MANSFVYDISTSIVAAFTPARAKISQDNDDCWITTHLTEQESTNRSEPLAPQSEHVFTGAEVLLYLMTLTTRYWFCINYIISYSTDSLCDVIHQDEVIISYILIIGYIFIWYAAGKTQAVIYLGDLDHWIKTEKKIGNKSSEEAILSNFCSQHEIDLVNGADILLSKKGDNDSTEHKEVCLKYDNQPKYNIKLCYNKKTKSTSDHDELSVILDYIQPDQWTKPPGTHIQVYTVPRFPENHNPLLPLSLQRKLNEMGPREFLTYVLNELTLEERESLMVDERQRRKTFQVTWPLEGNLSGIKMAQAGFYSVDDYDRVQCVFCRGSLHRWEQDDIPMLEHARSFAFCRFVKGLNCGNREYRSDKLSGDDLRNISMLNSAGSDRSNRNGTISVDSSTLGISTTRAAHIEYAPEPSRLRTYNRWPVTSALTKEKLCEAGFYFTGFDDQVRCFYCSGGLREWSLTDDPWIEHARWFPDCSFLVQQKGQDYIEEVHATTPANKKCVRKTVAQKKAETVEQETHSVQDMMYEVCRHLEYTDDQIEAAIKYHGGPFTDIRELIEVKYKLENGEISVPSTQEYSLTREVRHPIIAEEDRARALQVDNNPPRPGQMLASERRQKYDNACLTCENKTGRFVPACRVSLPCGHLTLCESCNTDEVNRASTNHSSKCMKCQGQLTGTMKVYFA